MEIVTHVEHKAYNNGKLVEDKEISMNYDGEKMNINTRSDGQSRHTVLSNKDIAEVFSKPMHSSALIKRLALDFKPTKTKKAERKHKKTTKKRNSRK